MAAVNHRVFSSPFFIIIRMLIQEGRVWKRLKSEGWVVVLPDGQQEDLFQFKILCKGEGGGCRGQRGGALPRDANRLQPPLHSFFHLSS